MTWQDLQVINLRKVLADQAKVKVVRGKKEIRAREGGASDEKHKRMERRGGVREEVCVKLSRDY
jgi:hypothetical protein